MAKTQTEAKQDSHLKEVLATLRSQQLAAGFDQVIELTDRAGDKAVAIV